MDVLSAPAKITEFDIVFIIEEQVLRLDITVENIIIMEVLDSFASLDKVLAGLLLIDFLFLLNIAIEVAIGDVLENDVNVVVFLEGVKQFDNVLEGSFHVDLDLSFDTFLLVRCSDIRSLDLNDDDLMRITILTA